MTDFLSYLFNKNKENVLLLQLISERYTIFIKITTLVNSVPSFRIKQAT